MEWVEEEGVKDVTKRHSAFDTVEMKQAKVIVTLKLDNEQEGGLKKWSARYSKSERGNDKHKNEHKHKTE